MADTQLGAGAPDGQGAGGGNPNPNPNDANPGDKGAGTGTGNGAPADKTYSYKEDRTDWTPRHRLTEESGKRQTAERERDQLKQQLDQATGRVRALAGVDKPDPKAAEKEELRSILYELAPELGALKGLTKEQLQEVLAAASEARGAAQNTWGRHATGMLNQVFSEASDILEVEKLTETQQSRLRAAYRDSASEALAARQAQMQRGERQSLETTSADKDFIARHEAGDTTLIKEFVKSYLDDFFEPARRSVTASNARRQFRPVPRGERTRVLPAQGEKKYKLDNDDDFQKALLEARASGGRE